MNNKMKKKLSILTICLAMSQASNVSAHNLTGKYLYSGDQAADVWQPSCLGEDTTGLGASINDIDPGRSNLSLLIYKEGKAVNTVDVSGGDGVNSPFVSLNMGPGVYTFIVAMSQAGVNKYDILFHCQDGKGGHPSGSTPTQPTQNEYPENESLF